MEVHKDVFATEFLMFREYPILGLILFVVNEWQIYVIIQNDSSAGTSARQCLQGMPLCQGLSLSLVSVIMNS